ncbi:hypothetical protein SPRG_08485 [Saprolegnia parasitica CBS 223.65]|uniref:RxLR effector protein n=1 Tax=Saprolegnia parasitica (strain CBS 223.65) TaxID=695850 RepID=A0A067C5U0_SAPPC|nr:hypothetical protein SPRG_08485 [Saprolegnia parasitica CBS 223.65]KDO26124.1 hypothetical protein SPRG_08485 [Saprolegnia parasitica CBS 223.65]|eukprot:XP_012203119.1 hypothetical protein SPRG_08485 [Saprolegnia parasitica CBS 223.65]
MTKLLGLLAACAALAAGQGNDTEPPTTLLLEPTTMTPTPTTVLLNTNLGANDDDTAGNTDHDADNDAHCHCNATTDDGPDDPSPTARDRGPRTSGHRGPDA